MYSVKKNTCLLLLILLISYTPRLHAGATSLPQPIRSLNSTIERAVEKKLQKSARKGTLYSISKLTNDISFQQAPPLKKRILAVKYLINKKNKLIREALQPFLLQEILNIILSTLFLISLFLFMEKIKNYITQFFPNPPNINYQNYVMQQPINPGNTIFKILFPMVLLTTASFILASITSFISLIAFYHSPHDLYQTLAPVEEKYISVKWLIKNSHKDYIQRIEASLINLRIDPRRQDLIKIITDILELIIYNKNNTLLYWDEKWANNILASFKPHIREQIKNVAFSFMLRINIYKTTGKRESYPVIFYGPPGTGKTYAANCIARILQVPAFQIDLGVSNETLFGKENQRSGSLTQALRYIFKQKNGDCAICICDDGDRAINKQKLATSWQLDLLDTSKTHYHDLFFNVNVQKPLAFIFTANYQQTLDPAIKNRFAYSINFHDPFTTTGIQIILQEHITTLIAKHSHLPYALHIEDFSNEEWHNLIKEAIQTKEQKKDKGIRTAKYILDAYYNKKTKDKYLLYTKRYH